MPKHFSRRHLTLSLSENSLALAHMHGMNEKFEHLVQGLLDHEYGTVDDFISPALLLQLRNNLLERYNGGKMVQAGVGQHSSFLENSQIRSDLISWMEDDHQDSGEEAYFRLIWDFMSYLNETCYTGLNGYESHFARYEQGSFYKRHLDQFKTNSGRKYSIVLYLNELWTEEDGGQLILYHQDQQIHILPKGGRVVFFQSDRVEHEVLPSHRPRMSIAGWMKSL